MANLKHIKYTTEAKYNAGTKSDDTLYAVPFELPDTIDGRKVFTATINNTTNQLIINDTAYDFVTVSNSSAPNTKLIMCRGYIWCQYSDTEWAQYNPTAILFGDTAGASGYVQVNLPTSKDGVQTMACLSDIPHLYLHSVFADLNYGTSSNLKGKIAFNFYDNDATAFSSSSSQSRLKGAVVSGAYFINDKSCNIYRLSNYNTIYATYFNADGTVGNDTWSFAITSFGGMWAKNIVDTVTQIY